MKNNDTPIILQDLKKKKGMMIPEDYFENTQNNIMHRINEEKPEVKALSIRRIMAYAASLVFIITSMYYIYQKNNASAIDTYSMDLTEEVYDEELQYEELTISDYYDELASVDLALEDEIEF